MIITWLPQWTEQNDWKTMISHILLEDYATAAGEANALGYDLFAFTDNTGSEKLYYLLEEKPATEKYWGTYVINPNPCRETLILQAPHPKFDFNTGKEAIYVFHDLDARAFMMSGTHRCNKSDQFPSPCDGTTKVCSSTNTSEPYRISDMAHVEESIFHVTTTQLMNDVPGGVFVQLHGFTKLSTDPYVIMSNGTDTAPPGTDYTIDIRDNLIVADPVLTFKIPHIDIGWTRLVGFKNTQGRWINNVIMPCTNDAIASSGNFIHIEQEKTRLRADATGWDKMSFALGETFSCGVLPVNLISFTATLKSGNQVLLEWVSMNEAQLSNYLVERSTDGSYFIPVMDIKATHSGYYSAMDTDIFHGKNYYRLKLKNEDSSFYFSKIILIENDISSIQWQVYPNPFEDFIVIENKDSFRSHCRLYDSFGNLVKVISLQPIELLKVNLSELPRGVYFLALFDDNGQLREVISLMRG